MRALLNRIIGPILKILGLTELVYNKITLFKNWLNYRQLKSKFGQRDIQKSKKDSKIRQVCIIDKHPKYINHFIDYYVKLGVDDFSFVITDETYAIEKILLSHNNVNITTYFTNDKSIKSESIFNFFIFKYDKQWLHLCTINQYLVYPQYKTRNISELCDFLHNIENNSVFGTVIHLYKANGKTDNSLNPFSSYKYIDKYNLIQQYNKGLDYFKVQGGPLLRLFHYDNPSESPVLNRLPIIKASKSLSFLNSNSYTNSNQYNSPLQKDSRVLTVAVLELIVDPAKYKKAIDFGDSFLNPFWSIKFVSDSQLEKLKFIQRGEWF